MKGEMGKWGNGVRNTKYFDDGGISKQLGESVFMTHLSGAKAESERGTLGSFRP